MNMRFSGRTNLRITAAILPALFCSSQSFAQSDSEIPLAESVSADSVGSTFDPNGPFDNDALVKGSFALPAAAPGEDDADPHGGSPPVNDACTNAIVIPANTVTYNPVLLNTTGASGGLCDPNDTCESGGVGVSNSVWYTYSPAMSGTATINTFGSNYDTVLSVWTNSCPALAPPSNCLNVPTQIACNDNYPFGTTSQVTLDVTAGQTYKIKVADYNTTDGGGLLDFNLFWAPANDLCVDATVIPGISYDPPTYNTANAADDLCENQETCEVNNVGTSNSVWYSYTPACDGTISINTNGSSYDTVLSVWDKCGAFVAVDFPCNYPDPLPVQTACDDDSGTGTASQLINVPVTAGQTYLIKVSDYDTNSGGGTLNFNFVFGGADLPVATITAPASLACVCGSVNVQGTASAGGGPVTWSLKQQPAGGSVWTTISSGTTAVTAATLGTWNTTGLPQNEYVLRLTVQNACGVTEAAVAVVFVDAAFDSFDVRAPLDGNLVAGTTCVDGTVWDRCFDEYTVMYRPSGGMIFTPVDAGSPVYTAAVINDPLAGPGWNTTGLADGNYELRVSAADSCGHTANVIRAVTIDNTVPTALISTPLSCSSVGGSVAITGTASDAHLAGWTLQFTGGTEHGWVTIASGSSSIVNGLLANWNTAGLPACAYTLRLIVTDATVLGCGPLRNQAEYTVSVRLAGAGMCCDVNSDGLSNGLDVAPFVECLINGACP